LTSHPGKPPDGQPAQLDGEQQDEEQRQPERRDRRAHLGGQHDQRVPHRAALQRGEDADRHGEERSQERRAQRQRDGDPEAIGDQPRHRSLELQRLAQVAPQRAEQPPAVALRGRDVEAEPGAHGGERLGRRVHAQDDGRRVAGDGQHRPEHDDAREHEAHERGQAAAEEVREHGGRPRPVPRALVARGTGWRDQRARYTWVRSMVGVGWSVQ
jgi:hypothetical protein